MGNLEKRIDKLEVQEGKGGAVIIDLQFGETQAQARERHFREHPEDRGKEPLFSYTIKDLLREGGREWLETLKREWHEA